MADFFAWIAGWLNALADFLMSGFDWLLTKAMIFGLGLLEWFITSIVGIIVALIDASNSLALLASTWANLPPGIIYIATVLQIPAAVSIILAAYVLRITIKLIPGI